jgi:hypothetical protein
MKEKQMNTLLSTHAARELSRFAEPTLLPIGVVVKTCLLLSGLLLLSNVTMAQKIHKCLPPPPGMVSWWPGDGNFNDIQNPTTVSLTSTNVNFSPGKVDQGFHFTGTPAGQFIDIFDLSAQSDPLNLRLQTLTIDAWVRPDGIGPNNDQFGSIVVMKGLQPPTGSWNDSVQINWRADQKFLFFFGNVPVHQIISAHQFPIGQFYHVAGTYDGQDFKLYVNGALEGKMPLIKTIAYDATPWTIGSAALVFRNAGFARTWNGVIDEVEIFNRALSQAEVLAIFNAGTAGKCKFSC